MRGGFANEARYPVREKGRITRSDRPRMAWRPGIGRRFAQGMDLLTDGLPETDTQLRCPLCEPGRRVVWREDAWKTKIDRLLGESMALLRPQITEDDRTAGRLHGALARDAEGPEPEFRLWFVERCGKQAEHEVVAGLVLLQSWPMEIQER